MKHYIVTLQVASGDACSLEKYIIPVNDNNSIETATEEALEEICFCDGWEIVDAEEVNTGYMITLQAARNLYHSKTGLTVEEGFISGNLTTTSAILHEIADLEGGKEK